MNQRKLAHDIVYKTLNVSSYSNLLLRNSLNKVDEDNRPFVTNLVYGTLENYYSLRYQLKGLYSKTSLYNEVILVMSLYEKFILKKEDFVTINEYVDLADSEYDKSFINAILRKIDTYIEPNEEHIKHNLPEWIFNLLKSQYSTEVFYRILENYKSKREIYYHINHNKCSFEDIKHLNINIINDDFFTSSNNLIDTKEFRNGLFYVQDINSSSMINNLELKENDLFLDACSAPGSKLFNALKYVKEENCFANDINNVRVHLIKNKAKTLGFNNINYLNHNASMLNSIISRKFNKILIDVPCSGLGVIGRKPDIKFHLEGSDLDKLQIVQYQILNNVSELLDKEGLLCYSTCTLNKKENSKQIQKFINEHNDFILLKEETIINVLGDMFYFAICKKV